MGPWPVEPWLVEAMVGGGWVVAGARARWCHVGRWLMTIEKIIKQR